jgi:hypothetical protein
LNRYLRRLISRHIRMVHNVVQWCLTTIIRFRNLSHILLTGQRVIKCLDLLESFRFRLIVFKRIDSCSVTARTCYRIVTWIRVWVHVFASELPSIARALVFGHQLMPSVILVVAQVYNIECLATLVFVFKYSLCKIDIISDLLFLLLFFHWFPSVHVSFILFNSFSIDFLLLNFILLLPPQLIYRCKVFIPSLIG